MTIPIGYAQINWICSGANLPTGAQFTLGVDISGYAGSPADLGAIAIIEYDDHIAPSVVDGCGISGVLVKFGPDATGPSALVSGNVNGEAAGTPSPPQVSYLALKHTALGGRAGRGRMYIPGVPEAQVGGSGVLEGTWRANLETGLNTVLAELALAGAEPVVLHQPGSPLLVPTPITSMTVSTRVATQRQRLRR